MAIWLSRLGSVLPIWTTPYYFTNSDTFTFTLLAVARANVFTATPSKGWNIA